MWGLRKDPLWTLDNFQWGVCKKLPFLQEVWGTKYLSELSAVLQDRKEINSKKVWILQVLQIQVLQVHGLVGKNQSLNFQAMLEKVLSFREKDAENCRCQGLFAFGNWYFNHVWCSPLNSDLNSVLRELAATVLNRGRGAGLWHENGVIYFWRLLFRMASDFP